MKQLSKILLVDDDATNNFLNEKLLIDLKIAQHVEVLTNGKLAFDYLLKHCTDPGQGCPLWVILDHHMPVMDGLEMMQALQVNGMLEKTNIFFLLLAIYSTPQDQELFKKLGVQEFTSKPLSKKTIMAAYAKYWANDTVENHTPE